MKNVMKIDPYKHRDLKKMIELEERVSCQLANATRYPMMPAISEYNYSTCPDYEESKEALIRILEGHKEINRETAYWINKDGFYGKVRWGW